MKVLLKFLIKLKGFIQMNFVHELLLVKFKQKYIQYVSSEDAWVMVVKCFDK